MAEITDAMVSVPRGLLHDLWCYGNLHHVENVLYGKPHKQRLSEADDILRLSARPASAGVGEVREALEWARDNCLGRTPDKNTMSGAEIDKYWDDYAAKIDRALAILSPAHAGSKPEGDG